MPDEQPQIDATTPDEPTVVLRPTDVETLVAAGFRLVRGVWTR